MTKRYDITGIGTSLEIGKDGSTISNGIGNDFFVAASTDGDITLTAGTVDGIVNLIPGASGTVQYNGIEIATVESAGLQPWTPLEGSEIVLVSNELSDNTTITPIAKGVAVTETAVGNPASGATDNFFALSNLYQGFYGMITDSVQADSSGYFLFSDSIGDWYQVGGAAMGFNWAWDTDHYEVNMLIYGPGSAWGYDSNDTIPEIRNKELAISAKLVGLDATLNIWINDGANISSTPPLFTFTQTLTAPQAADLAASLSRGLTTLYTPTGSIEQYDVPDLQYDNVTIYTEGGFIDPASYPTDPEDKAYITTGMASALDSDVGTIDNGYIVAFDAIGVPTTKTVKPADYLVDQSADYIWTGEHTFDGGAFFQSVFVDQQQLDNDDSGFLLVNHNRYQWWCKKLSGTYTATLPTVETSSADDYLPYVDFEVTGKFGETVDVTTDSNNFYIGGVDTGSATHSFTSGDTVRFIKAPTADSQSGGRWQIVYYASASGGGFDNTSLEAYVAAANISLTTTAGNITATSSGSIQLTSTGSAIFGSTSGATTVAATTDAFLQSSGGNIFVTASGGQVLFSGSTNISLSQQTSAMTGGTSDNYIATKKYVDDLPTTNQTITGEWGADISTSQSWWSGESDPLSAGGGDSYAINFLFPSGNRGFSAYSRETASTSNSSGFITTNSDNLAGGTTITFSCTGNGASNDINMTNDGEGGTRYTTMSLQTAAMIGGVSDNYIATKKYVDDNAGITNTSLAAYVAAAGISLTTSAGSDLDLICGNGGDINLSAGTSTDTDVIFAADHIDFKVNPFKGLPVTGAELRIYDDTNVHAGTITSPSSGTGRIVVSSVTGSAITFDSTMTIATTGGNIDIQSSADIRLQGPATGEVKTVIQTSAMNSGAPSDLAVATKKYVDDNIFTNTSLAAYTAAGAISLTSNTGSDISLNGGTGGNVTLSGTLNTVNADPTTALGIVTKQYSDLRNMGAATVAFDFNDTTVNIGSVLPDNAIVTSARINVTTTFDDGTSTIIVGNSTTTNGISSAADSDLTIVDLYSNDALFDVLTDGQLQLVVSAGTSTQGIGRVLVEYYIS